MRREGRRTFSLVVGLRKQRSVFLELLSDAVFSPEPFRRAIDLLKKAFAPTIEFNI